MISRHFCLFTHSFVCFAPYLSVYRFSIILYVIPVILTRPVLQITIVRGIVGHAGSSSGLSDRHGDGARRCAVIGHVLPARMKKAPADDDRCL